MIDYKSLPTKPGVYLFKNKRDEIIYVGKAKNLKKRVSSYFIKTFQSIKTSFLVKNIYDIDFIVLDNEVEALLLENKLIKKHKPKYNINLKDSKTYAYIKITDEKFPKIQTSRKLNKKDSFFGPFSDGYARRNLINLAVKIFKIRTCKTMPKRACLNYYIGICSAPCIGNISKEEYNKNIEDAKKFLKGNTKDVKSQLETEMRDFSVKKQYESALDRRDKIYAINHLETKQIVDNQNKYDQDYIATLSQDNKTIFELFKLDRGTIKSKEEYIFEDTKDIKDEFIKVYYSNKLIPKEIIIDFKIKDKSILGYLSKIKGSKVIVTTPLKGDKLRLLKIAKENAKYGSSIKVLQELKDQLNLPTIPNIIDAFDISNLSYTNNVGAMVRFSFGEEDKSNYRKFKIKSFSGKADDYSAIREVITRRYSKIDSQDITRPDLILIDGGLGQLNSAKIALDKLGIKIPIISLAKREEEIYIPNLDTPKKFDKNSKIMLYLRNIRDKVHRLAITYNRKRRQIDQREEFK